jgi:hypothetical protein
MAETAIKIIQTSEINPYKQVEMYHNFRPNIPERWRDITCPKPLEEVLKMVKAEKETRAEINKAEDTSKGRNLEAKKRIRQGRLCGRVVINICKNQFIYHCVAVSEIR